MNDKNKYFVIVVALSLSIIGALFYNIKIREASQPKARLDNQGTRVEEIDILIATKNIETGSVLATNDYKWHKWPKDAMNSEYFTRDQVDMVAKLTGAVTKNFINSDQPLRKSDLYLKGDQSALAVLLDPNTVAVALPLRSVDNAHMLYRPGDIIDVILPKRIDNARSEGEVILNTVKIIAVDNRFDIPLSEKIDKPPQVLILQLTRFQADKLAVALLEGHLIISQHSAFNDGRIDDKPVAESNVVKRINIVRGSQGGPMSMSPYPGAVN